MIMNLFRLITGIPFQIASKYVEMKLFGFIGTKWPSHSQKKKRNTFKKFLLKKMFVYFEKNLIFVKFVYGTFEFLRCCWK